MCPVNYFTMIRSENHRETLRKEMAKHAVAHGVSAAARNFRTTRATVRKWLRRYKQGESLADHSRRPRTSPTKTDEHTERLVLEARDKTNYGPHRLRDYLLRTHQNQIPVWTIRNILKRNGRMKRCKKRTACYPAHWAWEANAKPFTFVQADVKDVRDKGTLGTERTTHLDRCCFPRRQWTFQDAFTRMRFMAYSYECSLHCGLVFLTLCIRWVRAFGVVKPEDVIEIQTDWGGEFGGDNPNHVAELNEEIFKLLGAALRRYPLGRKQYNGRVERLHRTDDEEFYMPLLLTIRNVDEYLTRALEWQTFYNIHRPHYGKGLEGQTPMEKLRQHAPHTPDQFAQFPPILLDNIPICYPNQTGHDVQAKYSRLPAGLRHG